MSRFTFVAFLLLTGFFYSTGKPVDKSDRTGEPVMARGKQHSASGQVASLFSAPSGLSRHSETISPKKRASTPSLQPVLIHQDRLEKAPLVGEKTASRLPAFPVRNPRRIKVAQGRATITEAKTARRSPAVDQRSERHLVVAQKPFKNLTFENAQAKSTSAIVKPLAISYQQRHIHPSKPVIGPRLTTILLLRELRRVGCYKGTISSHWNKDAKEAVQEFNLNTNRNLAVRAASSTSLDSVQQVTRTVCRKKKPAGRAIFASAASSQAKHNLRPKTQLWKKRKTTYAALPAREKVAFKPELGSKGRKLKRKNYEATAIPAFKTRVKKRSYRAIAARRNRARQASKRRYARRTVQRKTAVRAWRRTYHRRKFRFRRSGINFSLD